MDRIENGGRIIPYKSEFNSSSGGQTGYEKKTTENSALPSAQTEAQEMEKEKDLFDGSTYLQFSVHKELSNVMIKVFDTKTGDLIREIPSEKVLDLVSKMMKQSGLIVDKKL